MTLQILFGQQTASCPRTVTEMSLDSSPPLIHTKMALFYGQIQILFSFNRDMLIYLWHFPATCRVTQSSNEMKWHPFHEYVMLTKQCKKVLLYIKRWRCVCLVISSVGTFQQSWESGAAGKKPYLPLQLWFSAKCLPAWYLGRPWDLLWKTNPKRSSWGKQELHKNLQIWISTWRLCPAVNFSFSPAKLVAFAWILIFTLSPLKT